MERIKNKNKTGCKKEEGEEDEVSRKKTNEKKLISETKKHVCHTSAVGQRSGLDTCLWGGRRLS